MLKVKEIFGPTIQGEGELAGSPAVFVRFAGCNRWNGKEETRAASSCAFCDTDFVGGELMDVPTVLQRIAELTPPGSRYLVVLTGGEPMLQNASDMVQLIREIQLSGNKVQMETNGTVWKPEVARSLNFITVSPKDPAEFLVCDWFHVTCLKLLHPYARVPVEPFVEIAKRLPFACIQPIDPVHTVDVQHPKGAQYAREAEWQRNTASAVALVKRLGDPWRLSLQTHKQIGEQ